MNSMTGQEFKEFLLNGAANLENHKNEIDALNVFPVPDGDTGTNMTLTISSGVNAIKNLESNNVSEVARAFSKGLLMGARGNSGVILSQIFRGLAKGLEDSNFIDAEKFAKSLIDARDTAYKAVMKPVEGTILTVIRETADQAAKEITSNHSFEELMETILTQSNETLRNTPELLPVLKEAGVVDSGGAGLVKVFEGMNEYLFGNIIVAKEQDATTQTVSAQALTKIDGDEFGYCTEFIMQLSDERVKKNQFTEDKLRLQLAKIGDSIVVVQDEDIVKVHVHTKRPGVAFNIGQQYGEFLRIKSENMSLQHEEIIHGEKEHVMNKEKKKYAVIAVAAGSGIADLFRELGADYIIEGGQTMNPSTEDFAKAIDEINADNVIILPNNSNIIMAAEQAAELSEINVKVVTSKTTPQGLTALLMFNEDDSLEDNYDNMSSALSEVKTGQITYAVRDTEMNGVKISEGDFMGIKDKEIVVSTQDKMEATKELIDKMVDDMSEVVTLLVGEDATNAEKEEVINYIEENHEDLEVEVYDGKQPVYSFILGVE